MERAKLGQPANKPEADAAFAQRRRYFVEWDLMQSIESDEHNQDFNAEPLGDRGVVESDDDRLFRESMLGNYGA